MKPRRKRLLPRPVTVLICAVLFSALAWLGFYAYREGFSKKWRRFVREEFQERGVELDFDKLTLDPFGGLVARGVRIYDGEERAHILATINHIALDIDLYRLAKEERFINTIDLRNASIALPISPDEPDGELLELSKINARIYLHGEEMELRKVDAQLYGIAVDITGSLLLPREETETESLDGEVESPPDDQTPLGDVVDAETAMENVAQRRRLLATFVRHMQRLEFGPGKAPHLSLRVNGQIDHPEAIMSQIELSCDEVRYAGFPLEDLALSANTRDGGFHLEHLEAKSGEESLQAHCSWIKGAPDIEWEINSTLDFPTLLQVAEIDVPDLPKFDAAPEIKLQGTWSLKPPEQVTPDGEESSATPILPLKCTGSLRCENFSTEGVDFEGLEATFSYDFGRYYIRNGLLSHRSGSLAFQAMMEEPGKFQHQATVKLDPTIFVPFAKTKGTLDVLNAFEFDNSSSIHINLTGSGTDHRASTWKTKGDIDLRDFKIRGTPFVRFESAFTTEPKKLFFHEIRIFRREGSAVAKMVHIDSAKRILLFDTFRGQLNPVETVAPFNEKISTGLKKYRFKEIPSFAIDGQIDTQKGGGARTDLTVTFESNGAAEYDFLGRTLPLTNARGRVIFRAKERDLDIGGNVFSGITRVTSSIGADGAYTAHFLAQDLSFEELAAVYSEGSKSKGDLDFTFDFKAAGKGIEKLIGSGQMQLSNGDVYAIPFLGPLSKPVATVLGSKNASYSVAREASATFTIKEGVVRTSDFEALTPYFRMSISGDIDCVAKQVQLDAGLNLRGAPGVLLLPVSKLLEFRGQGPLSAPVWAPKHLISPLSGSPDLRD